MKHARLTLALLSLPLFAGCSLAPTYKVPTVAMPASYKEAGIWQPAQPSDNLDRGDWWKNYDDETIDKLIGQLDAANPTLAAAVAHYDQAAAYEQQARASLYPTVSVGGAATENYQFYNHPHIEAGRGPGVSSPQHFTEQYGDIGASYELDLWGRIRNEVAAGTAQAQAAAADVESVKLSLHANLINNYIALRNFDAQSKLLNDVVTAYAKALTLTQNRFEGGADSALDVSRAQAQLDSAKAELTDIAASRSLYEHAIASLVGIPASSFSIAPAVINIALPNVPVGIPSKLLQRRPDIAAAERRVYAANAQIGVAKAAFYPTIMLDGGDTLDTIAAGSFLIAPTNVWMIGPTAFLTIFDAGRREAIVHQAQAVFNIAGANYRSTVLQAFQEVEDNLSLLNKLAQESQQVKAAIADSNKTLNIAMNRYREGMTNYLEVVTAQTSLLHVELQALNLRTRRLQANVNLVRALGGSYKNNMHSNS
ncbi:MAG: efflux transporter outer membrane subunit [Burkholderiales bacterium]